MPSVRQVAAFGFVLGVPYLMLFGVNQVRDLEDTGAGPLSGIFFAQSFGFVFLAATCGIGQRITRCSQSRLLPLLYAFAIAVVLPAAAWGWRHVQTTEATALPDKIPSALDILLVQPPSSAFGVPPRTPWLTDPSPEVEQWNVEFAVASVTNGERSSPMLRLRGAELKRGAALRELVAAQGKPQSSGKALLGPRLKWPGQRDNTASAVVLNVDGIHARALNEKSTGSMPADWTALFPESMAPPPIYVILGETDDARFSKWNSWARRRHGQAVRLRTTGEPLFVDAAVRIATEERRRLRHQVENEALAWQYRPILRFDSSEKPPPKPLDVEKLFRTGGITVDIKKGRFNLVLPKLRKQNLPSAIYYHAVREARKHRRMLFLDYWWYFPYNPTAVGRSGFCGSGFMIPGWTCFDHQSDWEGITVVLKKTATGVFAPWQVIYAQHEFGAAVKWQELWSRGLVEGTRPHVFVARDSHASYPVPCAKDEPRFAGLRKGPLARRRLRADDLLRDRCAQVHHSSYRKEGTHDGRVEWSRNDDAACGGTCLKPLLTTRRGIPGLWNTPLSWGGPTCAIEIWCDSGAAPLSPSYQGRFSKPWKPLDDGKWTKFEEGARDLPARYAKYD